MPFDSRTTYSPLYRAVPPTVPGTIEVRLDGNGTCFVLPIADNFDVTIGGTLGLLAMVPNFTCVGGTASGPVTLSITDPDYPTGLPSFFSGTGAWVATPAAATLEVVSPEFAGSGVFTRVSTDSVNCITHGLGSTTWSGPFAFEDPVL